MNYNYNEAFIQAYLVSRHSPDPSTQNGAVLLDKLGKYLVCGWNNFPKGIDTKYWYGEKADKYARVVHAETSAILHAAKLGYSTMNSTLVCPWAACSNCAKHIAAAGVNTLVRHPWEDQTTNNSWFNDCQLGDEIMREAGIKIIELPPVPYDIEIRRNGEVWRP